LVDTVDGERYRNGDLPSFISIVFQSFMAQDDPWFPGQKGLPEELSQNPGYRGSTFEGLFPFFA
jgi:hypothetical protein